MPLACPRPLLAGATAMALLGALAGCGVFKSNEEAQTIVGQRVVGMSAGDFFQQYGTFRRRFDQPDGGTEYLWVSALGPIPSAGLYGQDTATCTVRLVVAKSGRITVAEMLHDSPGRSSGSRCIEVFRPR